MAFANGLGARSIRDMMLDKAGISEGTSAGSGADLAQKVLAKEAGNINLATTNPGTGADLATTHAEYLQNN